MIIDGREIDIDSQTAPPRFVKHFSHHVPRTVLVLGAADVLGTLGFAGLD
jgi:hypothetical protein